ncbi:hypothetical protein JW899_03275 [Candidatus Uhrbacteria bacterium]|nr:hypothetical protein [Candidatus Uhrbacteria bacterium]
MRFIRNVDWEEVFNGWRSREAWNPGWVECATKVKGWPDWESWRRHTASQMRAAERDWKVYGLDDPMREVPEMLVGPYSGWQDRVVQAGAERNRTTFADFLDSGEQRDFFSGHDGVRKIMGGLPFATEFIGLIRGDTGQVVCIDGNHRATAISLTAKLGRPVDFTGIPVTFALTEMSVEGCREMDSILERGTSRSPKP